MTYVQGCPKKKTLEIIPIYSFYSVFLFPCAFIPGIKGSSQCKRFSIYIQLACMCTAISHKFWKQVGHLFHLIHCLYCWEPNCHCYVLMPNAFTGVLKVLQIGWSCINLVTIYYFISKSLNILYAFWFPQLAAWNHM